MYVEVVFDVWSTSWIRMWLWLWMCGSVPLGGGVDCSFFSILQLLFGRKAVFAFVANNYIPLGQWNSNSLLKNMGAGGL